MYITIVSCRSNEKQYPNPSPFIQNRIYEKREKSKKQELKNATNKMKNSLKRGAKKGKVVIKKAHSSVCDGRIGRVIAYTQGPTGTVAYEVMCVK